MEKNPEVIQIHRVDSCHVTRRAWDSKSCHVTLGCGTCREKLKTAEVDVVGKMEQNKAKFVICLMNSYSFYHTHVSYI